MNRPADPPRTEPYDPPDDAAQAHSARAAGEEILRTAATLDALLTEATRAESLAPLEARLLRTVREGVPQGELARLLAVDPARVSVLTAQLEERGLIVRVPARHDRRQRMAVLTADGRAAIERISARLVADSPLLRLSHPQRVQLVELLRRVTDPDGP